MNPVYVKEKVVHYVPPINNQAPTKTHKMFQCQKCPKEFKTEKERDEHSKIHFKCGMCDKSFISQERFKIHLKSHGAFTCDLCVCCFPTKVELESHNKTQHPNQLVASVRKKTKPLFHCEFCPEKFTTETNFRNHVSLVHSKKRKAAETITSSYEPLEETERFYTPPEKRALFEPEIPTCEPIDESISSNDEPERQFVPELKIQETFKCNQCPISYGTRERLRLHIDRYHNTEYYAPPKKDELRVHKCEQCEQTFTLKGNLMIHVKNVHHGVTYKCDICDMECSSAGSLLNHKKQIHPTESTKKYKCERCAYFTYTKSLFQKHVYNNHPLLDVPK